MKKIIFIIFSLISTIGISQNILTSGGLPIKSNSHILSSYDLPYKTNLIAWYNGDKSPKLDGNRVYEYSDLSGKSNNLIQITSTYQPTFDTDIMGRGYIRFDGSNDHMGTFDFYSKLPAQKYEWGIYMVIDKWAYGTLACGSRNQDGKQFLALRPSTVAQASIRPCQTGVEAGWWDGVGGSTCSEIAVVADTKLIIYATATTSGVNGKVQITVNNVLGSSSIEEPYHATSTLASFYIGGYLLQGNTSFRLYELIAYSIKPDAPNKIKIDNYLASKYSIPLGNNDIPYSKDYYIESILRDIGNLGAYGASYLQPITIPFTKYYESTSSVSNKYLIYNIADILTPLNIISNINSYCTCNCWGKGTYNYANVVYNCDTSKVALIVDTTSTCGYFPDMTLISEAVELDSTNFYCE